MLSSEPASVCCPSASSGTWHIRNAPLLTSGAPLRSPHLFDHQWPPDCPVASEGASAFTELHWLKEMVVGIRVQWPSAYNMVLLTRSFGRGLWSGSVFVSFTWSIVIGQPRTGGTFVGIRLPQSVGLCQIPGGGKLPSVP